MDKVIIFGIGQNAEVAYSYLSNDSSFEIVAFTVDNEFRNKEELFGLPVIPFCDIEKEYIPDALQSCIKISGNYRFFSHGFFPKNLRSNNMVYIYRLFFLI